VESFNDIFTAFENKARCVNIMSVDFSKAFNRMDHNACLYALEKFGASEYTSHIIHNFLSGRKMSVRHQQDHSTPRDVRGGSPQGSVLGNFLFCMTTNLLEVENLEVRRMNECCENLSEDRPAEDLSPALTSMETDEDSVKLYKFIDDYNLIQIVYDKSDCERLLASGCQKKYKSVEKAAKKIGMQINVRKTQLLCVITRVSRL
jgi:hypothetical protein